MKPRSAAHRSGRSPIRAQTMPLRNQPQWPDIIPAGQWSNYRSAIEAANDAGLQFLLGGGFGQAVYTGRWRNTKDMDFYILPRDREPMIAALTQAGFVDYYDTLPYDPGWIYRSTRAGIIVDIIWSMANRRAPVDELWFERSHPVQVRGESIQIVPAEELLWCKLYILQRDHSDWPDIFNLFYAVGPELDWEHILNRVGEDLPLLQAALTVFEWMCPDRQLKIPPRLRRRINAAAKPDREVPQDREARVKLLDSRAWFAPFQSQDKYLEV